MVEQDAVLALEEVTLDRVDIARSERVREQEAIVPGSPVEHIMPDAAVQYVVAVAAHQHVARRQT
jgi:hypothetical protein